MRSVTTRSSQPSHQSPHGVPDAVRRTAPRPRPSTLGRRHARAATGGRRLAPVDVRGANAVRPARVPVGTPVGPPPLRSVLPGVVRGRDSPASPRRGRPARPCAGGRPASPYPRRSSVAVAVEAGRQRKTVRRSPVSANPFDGGATSRTSRPRRPSTPGSGRPSRSATPRPCCRSPRSRSPARARRWRG